MLSLMDRGDSSGESTCTEEQAEHSAEALAAATRTTARAALVAARQLLRLASPVKFFRPKTSGVSVVRLLRASGRPNLGVRATVVTVPLAWESAISFVIFSIYGNMRKQLELHTDMPSWQQAYAAGSAMTLRR